jgi:hypothetical protein
MEVYGSPQPSWTIPSRDRSVGCGVRPRWPSKRREAVRKGRQPNPGLPVKRLHYRSDGDESVAPKFERHTVRPGFAA